MIMSNCLSPRVALELLTGNVLLAVCTDQCINALFTALFMPKASWMHKRIVGA